MRSERPRCARHGLVLPPGGACVLCKREQTPARAEPIVVAADRDAGDGPGSALVTWLLGLAAAASVAALIFLSPPGAAPAAQAVSAQAVRERPVTPALTTPSTAATSEPPSVATVQPAKTAPMPESAAAAVVPSPAKQADDVAAAARAAEDARRHDEVMAAIAARERARRSSTLTITMYSTSWCGACVAARDYMRAHDIAFTELDVGEDAAAKKRQLELNPRGSVPTIDVDGREVLVGFGAKTLEAAIARAAAARSGS